MTLYVDRAAIPYGRMKMSHMIADSPAELRRACDSLGLKCSYSQHPGTSREHLDLSLAKREVAVRDLSAREVSSREIIVIINRRKDGTPR